MLKSNSKKKKLLIWEKLLKLTRKTCEKSPMKCQVNLQQTTTKLKSLKFLLQKRKKYKSLQQNLKLRKTIMNNKLVKIKKLSQLYWNICKKIWHVKISCLLRMLWMKCVKILILNNVSWMMQKWLLPSFK